MKNDFFKIFIFLIIIIVPPASWAGLRQYNDRVYESLQYELDEKRELTTIDSLGELLTNGTLLTDYYADRAPFRSLVIKVNQRMDSILEKPYEKVIFPTAMKLYNITNDREVVSPSDTVIDETAYNDLFGEESSASKESETSIEEPVSEIVENHNFYEEIIKEATCFTTGIKAVKCLDCDYYSEEEIPRLTHDYQPYNVVTASYDDYGCEELMCSRCYKVKRENFTDKLIDDSYLAPTIKNNEVIMGRSNWLFLAGDGSLSYYSRDNVMSDEEMSVYVNKLSELNELCKKNGKQLAIILAPNKEQIYSEYMPTFNFGSTELRTKKLAEYVSDNSDVQISYVMDELLYAKRYWNLYYKYDSHWNAMGAFIGEQALMKMLGYSVTNPEYINLWWYTKTNKGDLIPLGSLSYDGYPEESDYEIQYKPDVTTVSLIEGSWDVITYYKTSSNAGNNVKALMIGDSFRINMIPFVSKEFSECSFVYKDNLWEAEADIPNSQVIIIECVERLDYKLLDTADWLIDYFIKHN